MKHYRNFLSMFGHVSQFGQSRETFLSETLTPCRAGVNDS